MLYLPSLLAVTPATVAWSPKVGLVMIICNVLAIAIGSYGIQHKNVGLGLPSSEFFGGMGHGAMLACTSLGHVIGIGAIIGLASIGVL
ncbi:MAG: photosystem I reaction center subunit PsaK [Cyanobacteria bacterium P01_B01_bin.77]